MFLNDLSLYKNHRCPTHIDRVGDEATLTFIEESLYLLPLGPREEDYDPL